MVMEMACKHEDGYMREIAVHIFASATGAEVEYGGI